MAKNTSRTDLRDHLLTAIPVACFFLVWQLLPFLGGLFESYIVPPTSVALVLWEMLRSGELIKHIGVSFQRAALGFLLSAAVAIPLGFVMGGWFHAVERVIGPILGFLAKLNPFSLFPLFVMLLGIGEISKTSIVAWVCLWPLLFRTISGVKDIDPSLIRAARSMGCGPLRLFIKVVVPGAIPEIFSGLEMACSTSFFILIAAEMIGASRGLGWLVWNAQMNFLIPKLFAATVTISVLGLGINYGLKKLERRLLHWRPAQEM